jgi:hypothetical protein
MPFAPFQPPKHAPGGSATVLPRGREQEVVALCYVRQPHLHSRQTYRRVLHWPHQHPVSARHANKEGTLKGFPAEYGCKRLLYFAGYEDLSSARLVQIGGGSPRIYAGEGALSDGVPTLLTHFSAGNAQGS